MSPQSEHGGAHEHVGSTTLRDVVTPADLTAVREIVASTGFFSPAEIDVAVELVQEHLSRGVASGYHFVFAERDGRNVGYACYGPIACTVGSYDLFWIAVEHRQHGRGIGKILLQASEERIARAGGRRIYVETSSRDQYRPTRAFYERCGYQAEARFEDFYNVGDDKIVYSKAVTPAHG